MPEKVKHGNKLSAGDRFKWEKDSFNFPVTAIDDHWKGDVSTKSTDVRKPLD